MVVAAAVADTVACGSPSAPRAQLIVVIDTDLPVPKADAESEAMRIDPPTLVDTARIELLRAGTMMSACSEARDCRHDLPLDETKLRDHLVTFGVVRARRTDVRVRLFRRTRATDDGEPPEAAAVEARVRLVDTDPDGPGPVIRERIDLSGDHWGRRVDPGLTEPPTYVEGADAPSRVGTWEGAAIVPCSSPPVDDGAPFNSERCIPGGAFYRSDPRITFAGNDFGVLPTRLAIVSPFYFDTYEYTVDKYLRDGLPDGAEPPLTYAADDAARPWRVACALGNPSPHAWALALNCLPQATADALCRARGRRLPTETEFELAATGRGQERFFPWGNGPPYETRRDGSLSACCDSGVFARQTPNEAVSGLVEQNECSFREPAPLTGFRPSLDEPVDGAEHAALSPSCAAKRDVSRDGVVGLGGNRSEWVRDSFAKADDSCWSGTGILRDPVCVPPSGAPFRPTLAGGNLFGAPLGMTGRVRASRGDAIVASTTAAGFRCARDGRAR